MARRATAPTDLVALAFELIAQRGWWGFGMAELAERAGLPLVEVYRQIPSRTALLRAFGRRLDEAMLAAERAEIVDLPPRERAFELLMRRFDALQAHREGVLALAREGGLDPQVALATLCNLERASAWLVEAGGLGVPGPRRLLARALVALAYGQALRVWLRDDTPDLARTMAELDRRLRQLAGLGLLGDSRPEAVVPPVAPVP